jgi:hypothetical protein
MKRISDELIGIVGAALVIALAIVAATAWGAAPEARQPQSPATVLPSPPAVPVQSASLAVLSSWITGTYRGVTPQQAWDCAKQNPGAKCPTQWLVANLTIQNTGTVDLRFGTEAGSSFGCGEWWLSDKTNDILSEACNPAYPYSFYPIFSVAPGQTSAPQTLVFGYNVWMGAAGVYTQVVFGNPGGSPVRAHL